MPYIKGNGIKDLYLIKVARVGSKQEAHPECPDNDYRLIFEVDFIEHFFKEYKPVHLNIWHTFTDTILSELLKMKDACILLWYKTNQNMLLEIKI